MICMTWFSWCLKNCDIRHLPYVFDAVSVQDVCNVGDFLDAGDLRNLRSMREVFDSLLSVTLIRLVTDLDQTSVSGTIVVQDKPSWENLPAAILKKFRIREDPGLQIWKSWLSLDLSVRNKTRIVTYTSPLLYIPAVTKSEELRRRRWWCQILGTLPLSATYIYLITKTFLLKI